MRDTYQYDAFISYRHTEKDAYVAETLHRALEMYKLDKKFKNKKIKRIFRDKDELPITSNLDDPIVTALNNSEFLIIICSPKYLESRWCKRELEVFLETHDKNKIITVLCDGEPHEAFPEEILYVEKEVNGKLEKVPVEPLAADVRGKNNKEIKNKISVEKLRILAQILDVNYDDLKQRHRERKLKKRATVATIGTVLGVTLGATSTVVALHINDQNEKIEHQNVILNQQNNSLLSYQGDYMAADSLALLSQGDVKGAVSLAKQALTEYNGVKMPYVSQARYALAESLRVFDSGNTLRAIKQFDNENIISGVVVSPDMETFVSYDEIGHIILWNGTTNEKIDVIQDFDYNNEEGVIYIDNNTIMYITNDNKVNVYNIADKKVQSFMDDLSANAIYTKETTEYFIIDSDDLITVCKKEDCSKLYDVEKSSFCYNDLEYFLLEDELIVGGKDKVDFIDLSNGENVHSVSSMIANEYTIDDVAEYDGNIYILSTSANLDILEFSTKVSCYDSNTKMLVWEKVYDDMSGKKFAPRANDESDELLFYTSFQIVAFDKNTGSQIKSYEVASTIVRIMANVSNNTYIIISRDGTYYILISESKNLTSYLSVFDCVTENIINIDLTNAGFIMYGTNDEKITVYNYIDNKDIKEYDGTIELDYDLPDETECIEEAKKLGLDKAPLVNNILYNEDKSVVFVSYQDNSIEVYKTEKMELIETIKEDFCDMYEMLGVDKEGNTYISGGTRGYCFDKEYKLIAKIPNLKAMDLDENVLIMDSGSDDLYTLPIFSLEDLLAKADEYLK